MDVPCILEGGERRGSVVWGSEAATPTRWALVSHRARVWGAWSEVPQVWSEVPQVDFRDGFECLRPFLTVSSTRKRKQL